MRTDRATRSVTLPWRGRVAGEAGGVGLSINLSKRPPPGSLTLATLPLSGEG